MRHTLHTGVFHLHTTTPCTILTLFLLCTFRNFTVKLAWLLSCALPLVIHIHLLQGVRPLHYIHIVICSSPIDSSWTHTFTPSYKTCKFHFGLSTSSSMVHGLWQSFARDPEILWLALIRWRVSSLGHHLWWILSMVDYHWQCKTHSNALKVQIDQRWWVIPAGHHSQWQTRWASWAPHCLAHRTISHLVSFSSAQVVVFQIGIKEIFKNPLNGKMKYGLFVNILDCNSIIIFSQAVTILNPLRSLWKRLGDKINTIFQKVKVFFLISAGEKHHQ